MSSNFMIGHPNRIDAATLSGGSWSIPLTNLQTRDSSQKARSTNAALLSTKFTITHTSAEVRIVGLVNGNFSSAAMWRVTTGTFDSGWVSVWRAAYTTAFRRDPLIVVTAGLSGSSTVVEIDDTGNSAGYVELSRVFIGGAFQPEHNASYAGFADGVEDFSTIQRLDSGGVYTYARATARTVRFGFDALSQSTEYLTVRDLLRTQGVSKEIWYAPWPGEPARLQTDGFLGLFRQLSPIEYPYYRTRKVGIEIAEIL